MRLICGLVYLDGTPATSQALNAMIAALGAPGLVPAVSQRIEDAAGLAVLDFSAKTAPLLPEGPDGTWLAGDVRLNRPTGPMEAQVLEALERWGQDIPDQLDGDFALAAWTPSARRLILGRDIMAIRPLCYTMQPGRLFAFASLPRGLHGAGFATTAPDIKAMGRMVIQPYFRGSATGYHDISWLPAGHSLTLTPQGMRLHQSWRIDPTRIGAWRGSDIEAATTLRNLIEDAVTCRLPPHGAVASHLSGGLDSSCISIIAARRLRETKRKLHAFSLLEQAWPAQDILSERFYIDAVLQQEPDIIWNANHLTSLSEGGIIDPDLIIDGPLEAPEEQICAKAASLGASLILSGAGGDECATFSGKSPWRRLPRYKWLSRMKRNLLRQPSLPEHAVLLSPELAEQISEDFDISADNPRLRFCNPLQSPFFGRATRWAIIGARHGVAFSFPLADR